MTSELSRTLASFRQDTWRDQTGFGDDIRDVQERMFASSAPEATEILNTWLQKYQPCLFGRLAAKSGALSYCAITDADIEAGDEVVHQKIQDARLAWSKRAFNGESSGFVIVVISRRLVQAEPDERVAAFAKRLVFLYLRREVELDAIYSEEVCLRYPGEPELAWLWYAGVNYFSSHGDGRWWRDHRIPGGMALSVNSVGHLVKSGKMANAMSQLAALLADERAVERPYPVNSLDRALEFAMRTISLAAPTPGGPATQLIPTKPANIEHFGKCPVELPAFLRDKDYCEYAGWYHTDVSLPSLYFKPNVTRPESAPQQSLDFTYLFHRDIENADYDVMGEGRRIRSAEPGSPSNAFVKHRRGEPVVVTLKDTELLRRAL